MVISEGPRAKRIRIGGSFAERKKETKMASDVEEEVETLSKVGGSFAEKQKASDLFR
jgi:hypothetical protein